MLIDWFTVFAQIINFLVLVWLLKRFLYSRIVQAIDTRESRIAVQIADAESREKQAGEQLALHQEKRAEIEAQRESILADAKSEAGAQQRIMLDLAREHVRALEEKWREDLEHQRETFLVDLRRRATAEILTITRRIIADLTGNDLEQCAVQVFLQKIRSLDDATWTRFAGTDIEIRTAMPLSQDQRTQIQQALHERIGSPLTLCFEEAPSIGLGIELRGNGWRVGWSADAYLQALEEDLNETFCQTSSAAAKAAP